MAGFVQLLGWLAFVVGGCLTFYGFTELGERQLYGGSPGVLYILGGMALIFQGALLCVFGEIAADLRAIRMNTAPSPDENPESLPAAAQATDHASDIFKWRRT